MRLSDSGRCAALILASALIITAPCSVLAQNQANVAFGGTRAFVTSVTPVIGAGGAVGGIEVDAEGVLRQVAVVPADGVSKTVKRRATEGNIKHPLRKISLARLEAAIAERASANERISEDMHFMAHLLRIEYVFVYPDQHDIVIAGPASKDCVVVGDAFVDAATMRPVLRLEDFVDALQCHQAAVNGGRISCSIDPTPEGTKRLQMFLKRGRLTHSEATMRRMERQLGPQVITVGGIRPASHFARVLVSADYTMKLLAMGLLSSPIDAVPSYMSLLRRTPGRSAIASPRFWLTPHYDSVERSEDGLAWRFQGSGLKANTEQGHVNARGEQVNEGKSSRLGQQWADQFSENYTALSEVLPIFGQLAGCVDATVLAALIHQHDLRMKAGCPLPMLTDADKLSGEDYRVPTRVPSMASATRSGGTWIVGVSGGVELNPSSVLGDARVSSSLTQMRQRQWSDSDSWWWDE